VSELFLKITGLDCVNCARGLENSLKAVPGVEDADLSFFDGLLKVRGQVAEKELRKAIKRLGYDVDDGTDTRSDASNTSNPKLGFWQYITSRPDTILWLIAGGIVILSWVFRWFGFQDWVVIGLQVIALALAGWPIARKGLVTLWNTRTININFLMTLAGIGAVVIGEYFEAASLIILFNFAEALEGFTNTRVQSSLTQLQELTATHAVKLVNGGERLVPAESLAVGNQILVRAGERIPIDGVILEGASDINQAPVTGESIPVWKKQSDEVYSGTINGNGVLTVEVTHLSVDSTLHRIIEMVTEAQSRRSHRQKRIDRIAKYYTPAMVLLAVLMTTIPTIFMNEPLLNLADGTRGWLHRALTLLVISCPCALVISTPVTMTASIIKAIREGVLFKGGIFVEGLEKVKAFAFDKTGTLTTGLPRVVACKDITCAESPSCEACDDMLALAYALERHSTHPLAKAIIHEAEQRQVIDRYPLAADLITRGGLGLEGIINGHRMTIGSLKLFEQEHKIPAAVHDWVNKAESEGKTAMLLCDGEKVRGYIAVEDTPRVESREVVKDLRKLGKETIMLTGDNLTVAKAVGKAIGLDEVRSGLLPGDKQAAISSLQAKYGSVCMVGDGINDAPALASADIGIAMGGSGSAQAMETADVVLMGDDIQKLPFAINLSKFANRLVLQNIIFSLGSKLIVAVIAMLGYAPLWLAVVADMGVSLLVTMNGLRVTQIQN